MRQSSAELTEYSVKIQIYFLGLLMIQPYPLFAKLRKNCDQIQNGFHSTYHNLCVSTVMIDSQRSTTMVKLLTAEEVAAIINCGPSTIYQWAQCGMIPSCRINGLVRFVPSEIHAWIEKSKRLESNPIKSPWCSSRPRSKTDICRLIRKAVDSEKKRHYNKTHIGEAGPTQAQKGGE